MKNLKKVLALVVAVAMFASFACVASADSYSDVASTASYADAVNLLSNLGIITGYEDGTFKPENTVTRAEAATMMVRMLGLADGVEKGNTQFTDVDANHWASGYINVAVNNGIVNGMGDGTFAPEATLTYGQIVKMIVCALGYEPVAKANGGWLGGGYLYAASKAGFTKGVNGTQDEAASRATVAVLMYKALEVELMEQDSYSTGISGDTFKVQKDKTILSEYLELEKVEGVIVSTYLSNSVYTEGDNEVEIVITKNYADDAEYEVGDTVPVIADGVNASSLLGYSVVAYVGENEDGDDEMFAVSAKSGKNSVLTLDTDLVEALSDTEVVYYKSESARNTTTAEIQPYVEIKSGDVDVDGFVVVNGFNNVDYTNEFGIIANYKNLEEITFIDNDNDGDYEFIVAICPSARDAAEFVVEEIDADDFILTGVDGDGEINLDYDDTDVLITIIKDGAVVGFDAIVEGDVVTCLDTAVNVLTLYVSSKVVEGTVDEVEDDVFTISGKEYKISPIVLLDGGLATDDIAAGDEGVYYINALGKIVYVDTVSSVTGADYVYVIDADDQDGDFGDTSYIVKVVTAKGEVEVLKIKSKKVDVFEANGEKKEKLEAGTVYNDYFKGYEGIVKIDTTAAGEISAVWFPGYDKKFVADDTYENDADNEKKSYNEARGTYGSFDLAASTLVFNKDTSEADLEDAITVSTVGNVFVDGSSYSFVAYGEKDKDPEVLVTTDAKASIDAEAPVMVVTKVTKVVSDDDDTIKITGVVAGETVSVIVDPDENLTLADVEKYNVILYAMSSGYATDVAVLYSSTVDGKGDLNGTDKITVGATTDENVTIHFGEITDKATKSFTIDTVEEPFFYGDNVNYIVIDYATSTPSVKVGSKSDVKKSTEDNTYYAFVKTISDIEDEATDIVIFKGLN